MALNVRQGTKEYAEIGSDVPIPRTDLTEIIGTLVERYRHSETVATASTATPCIQIGYKPLTAAVEYRLLITGSDGTVKVEGTIEALTWQGIAHADAGDTLVHDGQPTQTGHRIQPPAAAADPTIMVGRTDTNFLLFQGVALAVGDVIEVFSTEYTGGEITERLLRQTSGAPHRIRLKGLFSGTPTEPPTLGYDGSYATGIAGTNWVELDESFPNPDSGGTVYNLFADATYNPVAAAWVVSNVYIFSPEGGTNVEYSESDTGPWHAAQTATDKWRRWRDSLLLWHIDPLNPLEDGWQYLINFVWDGTATPALGSYSDWQRTFAFPVDFDEWKTLLCTMQWSGDDGFSSIEIPCNILRSGLTTDTGFANGKGRTLHFRRAGTGASYDDANYNSGRTATRTILGLYMQLLRLPDEAENSASKVRVNIAGSGVVATLRFYVGR